MVDVRYSRLLVDGERVVFGTRRHPVTLARPFFVAAAVIVGALAVGYVITPRDGGDLVDTVVGIIAVIFFVRFLWRVGEWRGTRILVTDRRLIQVSGVLTRKVSSTPLARLTDLTYRRGVLGRLLGFGEITVDSAEVERGPRLDHLPRPDDFYRTITRLIASIAPPTDDGPPAPKWDEADTGPLPRVIV